LPEEVKPGDHVGIYVSMKTRLVCLSIALCCVIAAGDAIAQDAKWRTIRSQQWGFSFQLPPGATRRPLADRPPQGTCDVYAAGGLACVVQVTPTASDALASTAIEQAIQADVKEASKLGSAARWEATSKQGDLFKGFTGRVQLSKTDAAQAMVFRSIGADSGVQSVALAPLGDESAPVLRIAVVGIPNRENEVVAMAKAIASLVTTGPQPLVQAPNPEPTPTPAPTPVAKPWAALKSGEIELAGTVESVSKDGRTVTMTVDTVTVIGQEPITLSPTRPKRVLLKSKLRWLTQGLYVRLIGKNSGVGKPIQADAMEQTPAPAPQPIPPGPVPPA
jgi:hypothetical protein